MKITIDINDGVLKELEYMVELHEAYGAPAKIETVERLIQYALAHIADGSRRPGAWERQLLTMMGLVADGQVHHIWFYPRCRTNHIHALWRYMGR